MNSVMVSGAKWTGKFTGAASWQTPGPVTIPTPVGGVAIQTVNCICTTPGNAPVSTILTVTYKFSTKCKIDNKPVLESMSSSSIFVSQVTSGFHTNTVIVPAIFTITGDSKKVKDSAAWMTKQGASKSNSITFVDTGQRKVNVD